MDNVLFLLPTNVHSESYFPKINTNSEALQNHYYFSWIGNTGNMTRNAGRKARSTPGAKSNGLCSNF